MIHFHTHLKEICMIESTNMLFVINNDLAAPTNCTKCKQIIVFTSLTLQPSVRYLTETNRYSNFEINL